MKAFVLCANVGQNTGKVYYSLSAKMMNTSISMWLFAVIYVFWRCCTNKVTFPFPLDLPLFREPKVLDSNPAFDPVILKVNANPERADIGGFKCYTSHKNPWEGRQSHLCPNQMPSQQQALPLKLLICVSVECLGVEELISFYLFFFKARAAVLLRTQEFLCLWTGLRLEAWLWIKWALCLWLHFTYYFCPSLEPDYIHAVSHLPSRGNAKG